MTPIVAWIESVRPSATGGTWEAVERGGSDRRFWRGRGAAAGLMAVHYGMEKEENARYADCANFLRERGVNVPRVWAHDAAMRFLLMQDAGEEDLWAHREGTRSTREKIYREALTQAAALHACNLVEADAAGVLQAPFDERLYKWEQEYFREYFLRGEFDVETAAALAEQAKELAALPRVLVHRDFQSQNVMVSGGAVSLIDFQGMRAGLAGYDVASLLYDPYVDMTPEERDGLMDYYRALTGRAGGATWHREFRACARQRLMQALGAYGFLGRIKGRKNFLAHIPAAAERLAALCDGEAAWRPLGREVRRAAEAQKL